MIAVCKRCGGEKAKYRRDYCGCCYQATLYNRETRKEKLPKRNYIENGVGVLTSLKGERWIVDLDDFERCSKEFWVGNKGYAYSNRVGKLHRFLKPNLEIVDHINMDTHDNRKCNLREGRGINQLNTLKRKFGVSGYHGVHRKRNKWEARITINNKKCRLGVFDDAHKAACVVYEFAKRRGRDEYYRIDM